MEQPAENKSPQDGSAIDSVVLEEEIDPNYVPSEPEVVEYAKWLGMDLEKDHDLFWIAREGLMAPLPKDWKPCKTKDTEDIYYFNFTSGESTWDHPCDGYYKRLYEEEKKKKETVIKESGDQNRSKAKQDVEQLLGKADKKKKKKTTSDLASIDMVKPLPAPLGLQKKPLPGISISGPAKFGSASSLGSLSMHTDVGIVGPGKIHPPRANSDLRVTSSLDGALGNLSSVSSSQTKPLGSLAVASSDSRPSSAGPSISLTRNAPLSSSSLIGVDKAADAKVAEAERGLREEEGKFSAGPASVGGAAGTDHNWQYENAAGKQIVVDVAQEKASSPRGGPGKQGREGMDSDDRRISNQHHAQDEKSSYPAYLAGPAVSTVSVPTAAAQQQSSAELIRLRDKCAVLERQLEQSEQRVADYSSSYTTAKEELASLERRFEANNALWKEKVRALEVERDAAESERRRLKVELADLESKAAVKSVPLSASDIKDNKDTDLGANSTVNVDVDLRKELESARLALARSAATHSELELKMSQVIAKHEKEIADICAERDESRNECAHLTEAMQDVKRIAAEVRESSQQQQLLQFQSDSSSDLIEELSQERALALMKDAEIERLNDRMVNEKSRCEGLLDQIRAMGVSGEQQLRVVVEEKAALAGQIEDLRSKLSLAAIELESLRANSGAAETEQSRRADAAEAQQRALEGLLTDMRSLEANLRKELSDKDRKLSEEQERFLALQAERNTSNYNSSSQQNSESERGVQFDTFASQATAVRKSLKAEIERLKTHLQDVETEKSGLLTQLTRQETTLQFAKKELNDVAATKESVRQLETEKHVLSAQLDSAKDSISRYIAQERELKERCEKLLRTSVEDEEVRKELRAENTRLLTALEAERSSVQQKEKKIKSYQGELLQLQRRMAETSSPAPVAGPAISTSSNPASPLFFQPAPSAALTNTDSKSKNDLLATQEEELGKLQNQLQSKQVELDAALRRSAENSKQLEEVQKHFNDMEVASAERFHASNSALQAQLDAKIMEHRRLQNAYDTLVAQTTDSAATSASSEERTAELLSEALQRAASLESEKACLLSQLRDVRNQLASAQLSVELHSSSARLAADEASSYKEKWMSSEKELTDLRLMSARASSSAQVEISKLQGQINELQVNNETNACTVNELMFYKQECSNLRTSLSEKNAQITKLHYDISSKSRMQSAKDECDEMGDNETASKMSVRNAAPSVPVAPSLPSHEATQQLVALSLEVGRQQASMLRMEEHMRNTEKLLKEFKTRGQTAVSASSPSTDDSVLLPSSMRRSSYDVPQSNNTPSPESVSLLPQRIKPRSILTNKMSVTNTSNINHGHKHWDGRSLGDTEMEEEEEYNSLTNLSPLQSYNVATRSRKAESSCSISANDVAALVRRHELDEYEFTTLPSSGSRAPADLDLELSRSSAARVAVSAKNLLKRETRFLRELQSKCSAAKAEILKDQAEVKRIKALWRSTKDRRGHEAVLNTDSINSITMQLNGAVDELRDAQVIVKYTEKRNKALSQSLQYLEEILAMATTQSASMEPQRVAELFNRISDVAQRVQQKCSESVAEYISLIPPRPSRPTHHHHLQQQHQQKHQYTNKAVSWTAPLHHQNSSSPARAKSWASAARLPRQSYSRVSHSQSEVRDEKKKKSEYEARGLGMMRMVGDYECEWDAGLAGAPDLNSEDLFITGSTAAALSRPPLSTTSSAGARAADTNQFNLPQHHQRRPSTVTSMTSVPSSALSGIRSTEERARILQEQIQKITERQSQSKDACDKHAGWLDMLHREISDVTHSYPRPRTHTHNENSTFTEDKCHHTNAKSSGKVGTGTMDYALEFEANARLSNSRRAFGDVQNISPIPMTTISSASAADAAGVNSFATF